MCYFLKDTLDCSIKTTSLVFLFCSEIVFVLANVIYAYKSLWILLLRHPQSYVRIWLSACWIKWRHYWLWLLYREGNKISYYLMWDLQDSSSEMEFLLKHSYTNIYIIWILLGLVVVKGCLLHFTNGFYIDYQSKSQICHMSDKTFLFNYSGFRSIFVPER